METKVCTKCGKEQPVDHFARDKNRRSGRCPQCKTCRSAYIRSYYARPEVREKKRVYTAAHKEERKEYLRNYSINWQKNNKDKVAKIGRAYRDRHPLRSMLNRVKYRAKSLEIPFNLTVDDLVVPSHCPIFGVPLFVCSGRGQPKDDSASVDRIVPQLGYVKGNVAVISKHANTVKNDGTAEEHEKIAAWMRSR